MAGENEKAQDTWIWINLNRIAIKGLPISLLPCGYLTSLSLSFSKCQYLPLQDSVGQKAVYVKVLAQGLGHNK